MKQETKELIKFIKKALNQDLRHLAVLPGPEGLEEYNSHKLLKEKADAFLDSLEENEFQFKIPNDLKEMIKDARLGMFIAYSSNVLTGIVEKEVGIQQGGHLLGVYHSSKDGDFDEWWDKLKKTKKV